MKRYIERLLILFLLFALYANLAGLEVAAERNAVDKTDTLEGANVRFVFYDLQKRFYNKWGDYVELDLKLPLLDGEYEGIPKINQFFEERANYFESEVPKEELNSDYAEWRLEGRNSNHYRSAYYNLEIVMGNFISISAKTNGGAGGVGWAGAEGNTFNLQTGKRLNLSDIFSIEESEYMDLIYRFVINTIEEVNSRAEMGAVGSPYECPLSEKGIRAVRNSYNPADFYLTHRYLVVFYEKYALAAGAAGVRRFFIPYEEIYEKLHKNIRDAIPTQNRVPEKLSFTVEEQFISKHMQDTAVIAMLSGKKLGEEESESYIDNM